MRCLGLVLVLFSVSTWALPEKDFYIVPTKNLDLMKARPLSLSHSGELELVQLSQNEIEELSGVIHSKRFVCGGFTAAEPLIRTLGLSPIEILKWSAQRPLRLLSFQNRSLEFPVQSKKAIASVNKDSFVKNLEEMAAFPDRYASSATGAETPHWLQKKVESMAKDYSRSDLEYRFVPTAGKYKQESLVVTLKGSRGDLPGVVIGGHIDTYRDRKPGADDDASGSITVLETLHAIFEAGLKFERNIYFAFYAAEEWGLYGSQSVVQEFKRKGTPVQAVMQLDMTGYHDRSNPEKLNFITDFVDSELTGFTKKIAMEHLGIPEKEIGMSECGYACSDHASWSHDGYPSVFPFETDSEKYNSKIHTGDDRISLLDIDHAMGFLKLGVAFVVELGRPL